DHPLSKTSFTRVMSEKSQTIPNFIGGSLPRRDGDDRENYSMTMLVLFRPWRTGVQLKHNDLTWTESFTQYEFDPRHTDFMKFINVRHECKDAADDYYAQLRASDKT
ncbi:hypothetical protein BDN72DRAFT_748076, partial [Pluteus cervinus]